MRSMAANSAFMDKKISFIDAAIISNSFTSMPDETIADSLEKCTANGTSCLFIPFTYPPLLRLFDSPTSALTHEFPATPSVKSILNNPGYAYLEREMEKYGFYVSAILVGRDHAEITITKTPPEMPIRQYSEVRLG